MSESVAHHKTLGRYLRALWTDGTAAMGATLGVLAGFGAAYLAFIRDRNIAVLWVVALLGFLVAGYRVWLKELRMRLDAETKLARPKLIGFFQDVTSSYFFKDTDRAPNRLLEPLEIAGTQISVYARIVNDNSTPCTMHDLGFELECEGVKYVANHAEDYQTQSGIMSFEEIRGAEQIASRSLVGMLEKIELTRGRGIEGFATFKLPGFDAVSHMVHDGEARPVDVSITLCIEDSYGSIHRITDQWGRELRPSRRILRDPKPPFLS